MNVKKADTGSRAETSRLKPALVLGGGIAGLIVSRALLNVGIPVTLISAPQVPDDLFCAGSGFNMDEFVRALRDATQGAKSLDVHQWPPVLREGHLFRARIAESKEELFGCVFIAPGLSLVPPDRLLPPGSEAVSSNGLAGRPGKIGFLLDYSTASAPAAGMLAIRQALENAEAGGQSFVLFKNAPVVHLFGEELYEQARNAGVRFHRFGDELPYVEPLEGASGARKHFRVLIRDVIEAGEPVTFECDRIVQATHVEVSSVPLAALAVADGDLDRQGFILSESVHCHSGRSFRNGVFAIGSTTGTSDLLRILTEASAAAVEARAWMLRAESQQDAQTVTIGTECCRCLTCSRVCPHAAVSLEGGIARSSIHVSGPLCQECGVCVSECPRLVLDLNRMPEADVAAFLEDLKLRRDEDLVVLYGCQRSAGKLVEAIELPASVVPFTVPCAGRISEAVVWATLAAGARGVLVAGCHHGNCRSDTGTDWAAAHVVSLLETLGFSPGIDAPVRYATIAANESARFARLVADFAATAGRTHDSRNWFGKVETA